MTSFYLRFLIISSLVLLGGGVAFASEALPEQIDWLTMTMGLLGGLSLFLFGMEQLSSGLKAVAGENLQLLLSKLTKNRFMGAITGAFVTAVLNSSSVTTVLVVGFITAGIMNLSQSIGVIMGANIGSTFTAQIIAFNITQYALIMVSAGFLMLFTAKHEKMRHYGTMIMGLGLIFYGMGIMSTATVPLRSYQPFLDLMVRMEQPALGILVGALFTGLVQSSAATTGIAIAMASEGLMTLPAGIALAFGANVGTCATALLASIGKPTQAKRAAAAHILFNVLGVLLWVFFIPDLANIVTELSPQHPELKGTARMASEVPRQIANAHTVFNIANTLIFIGFTGVFAKIVEKLIPEHYNKPTVIISPKFLDEAALNTPSIALEQVRLEIGHSGELVESMLKKIAPAIQQSSRKQLEEIAKIDDRVDILHSATLDYLSAIRQQQLTDKQNQSFLLLMSATEDIARIAEVIKNNFIPLGYRIIDEKIIELGNEDNSVIFQIINGLYGRVSDSVHHAINSVRETNQREAQTVVSMKSELNHLVSEIIEYQSHVSSTSIPHKQWMLLLRTEAEIIDNLKRIYSLAKRIARTNLPSVLLQEEE